MLTLSIAIPTYGRESILVDTIHSLLDLHPKAAEILVLDQTPRHEPETEWQLIDWSQRGLIRRIRLAKPSIPAAMNMGLMEAVSPVILFLDDDVIPRRDLVERHLEAHCHCGLVAGQVLQPGQLPRTLATGEAFRFNSTEPAWIDEFIGCHFSVARQQALAIGGFDENFVGAAFRFEAEFAWRYSLSYGRIFFSPSASIRHLAAPSGGTRAWGHHLRTASPSHSAGAYYYLMCCRPRKWLLQLLWRPLRSVRTRFHFTHPWWIPVTFLAELRGFMAAFRLCLRGPRLLTPGVQAASA